MAGKQQIDNAMDTNPRHEKKIVHWIKAVAKVEVRQYNPKWRKYVAFPVCSAATRQWMDLKGEGEWYSHNEKR